MSAINMTHFTQFAMHWWCAAWFTKSYRIHKIQCTDCKTRLIIQLHSLTVISPGSITDWWTDRNQSCAQYYELWCKMDSSAKRATRRSTSVWLVGNEKEVLQGRQLPSKRDGLECFYYQQRQFTTSDQQSILTVVRMCRAFYEVLQIPTMAESDAAKL